MNVLVTTDGSERSLRILPHASLLAESLGGELMLTRVLDPRQDVADEMAPSVREATERVQTRWETELQRLLEVRNLPGRPLVTVRDGNTDISRCIVASADDIDAAVIAIDSRGRGALRRALLGSVAMDILARTERPVMVGGDQLEQPQTTASPYHIVVLDDGSESARKILPSLEPLFVPGEVRVTLLNIFEANPRGGGHTSLTAAQSHLESLREALPAGIDSSIHVEEIAKLGGIDSAAVAFATREGAHAIALATHGHSAARTIFAGSTGQGLLRQSPIPVIMRRTS